MPELVGITGYGLFVPARVRPDIVARLSVKMNRILRSPGVRQVLARVAVDPAPSSPPEFAPFFRDEVGKWARVIREANIRAE